VSVEDQYLALLDGTPSWDEHLRVVSPKVWQRLVLMRDNGCVLKGQGPCDGDFEAHHIITQQQLRKRGLSDIAWDVRNGMGLCYRHHRRHTNATERVPYTALPERAHEFAAELGLGWLLDRFYPKEAAA
jgi:hypothetical protein